MSVGVAVVGTGFGCFTHVRALQAAGFEVHALVGRDPVKTARRAEAVGVPHACGSLAEALGWPGTDAVTIATPPHTHAAFVLEAVAAGRHVLCEKPFARDATWAELGAHYDAPALVEILFVVGQYTMLSMVANAAGIPA